MDISTQRRLVLADVTPLFAAFNPDDQYYARAQADLTRLEVEGRRVAILTTTVLEAYSLILYRQGTRAAQEWLRQITRASVRIHPEHDDIDAAVQLVHRYTDQDLTIFDAIVHVVSERLNVPVWTYDHHFDVLRSQRWYGE